MYPSWQRSFFKSLRYNRGSEVLRHPNLDQLSHSESGYVSSLLQHGFFVSSEGASSRDHKDPHVPLPVSRHQLVHSSLRSLYRSHNRFFPLYPFLYVYRQPHFTFDRATLMYATGRPSNVHFLSAKGSLSSPEDRGIRGLERCSGLLCPPNNLLSSILLPICMWRSRIDSQLCLQYTPLWLRYTPPIVQSTMCSVYTPLCLHLTVCILNHVYTWPCLSLSLRVSLRVSLGVSLGVSLLVSLRLFLRMSPRDPLYVSQQ